MTPSERFWDNVYRSGFLGAGQFAIDAKRSHQFGASPFATLLGPTATQVELAVKRPTKALSTALPITGQSQFLQEQIGEALFEPEAAGSSVGPTLGSGKELGGGKPLGRESGGPITSGEVVDETEWLTSRYDPILNKYGIKARRAERPVNIYDVQMKVVSDPRWEEEVDTPSIILLKNVIILWQELL